MKAWHDGLPEADTFSLFPPAGQIRAYTEDRARIESRLREMFPELKFEIVDMSLSKDVAIIPICGEAGEGGRGMFAAPPSPKRMLEIESRLVALDLERTDPS